jgi:pyruvate/2-oxoglutarate dehydrogenase complex dihydrolipoamide acyltransferase (E2) component
VAEAVTAFPAPVVAPEVAPEVTPAVAAAPPVADAPPVEPVASAAVAPADLLPAAREVLATPEARSVAAVFAIALAVLLFLALHGRFDRAEPKLIDGGDGRDLARFL